MRVIIPYHSFSGNTEEVAEILRDKLVGKYGCEVVMYEMEYENYFPNMEEYDLILMGTFTWAMGATPDEVKDFVADIGYKPDNIAIFGTGETQFGGEEMYCAAVTKLSKFYNTKWEGLKIEQSPRGSQEIKVHRWINNIMEDVLSKREVSYEEVI